MKARPVIYQTQLHEYDSLQQQRLVMPLAALCVVSLGNSSMGAKGGGQR